MNNQRKMLFSIIICAHNRKKYLTDAMKSVLSQEFPRENYEVILVRNFPDKRVDAFTSKNGITDIKTDKAPLMQKMIVGVDNANGEYLCFLEDDDLYETNKLSRINDLIDKHKSLSYYHSSFKAIDEKGKLMGQKISRVNERTLIYKGELDILAGISEMLRSRADWYGSMMCIRKKALIPHLKLLREIEGSADKIIFYIGLLDHGTVIIDSEKTTRYRFHQSHTTVVADYEFFISKKNTFYTKSLESAKILEKICSGTFLEGTSRCYVLHEEVLSKFTAFGNSGKLLPLAPGVMECFRKTGMKNILLWYTLLLAKTLFGRSILKFYYMISSATSRKATQI